MHTRPRRAPSLEVSAAQREILELAMVTLSKSEHDAAALRSLIPLTSLFYHPNADCRAIALLLSAGGDAIKGNVDNVNRKLDRAIQVMSLGEANTDISHLEALRETWASGSRVERQDVSGFISEVQSVAELWLKRLLSDESTLLDDESGSDDTSSESSDETSSESTRDAELALEEESTDSGEIAANYEQSPDDEGIEAEDSVDEFEDTAKPALESAHADLAAGDHVDEDGYEFEQAVSDLELVAATEILEEVDGDAAISAEEAARAAAAARSAIAAPYEEVVEVHSRRFDPDRDIEPETQNQGRRRRRSKAPIGLERPRPDQVAQALEKKESSENTSTDEESAPLSNVVATRGGHSVEVAEVVLEAAKLALRRFRDTDLEGRIKVEVIISADVESRGRRRRRRRRRPTGNR